MAEKEAQWLQTTEQGRLSSIFKERRTGQFLGFGIAIIALGTSAFCAWIGQPGPASVIGGTTVVGLVGAFLVGHIRKDNKQKEKNEE